MEAAHGAPVAARNGGVSLPLMSTSSSSSSQPSRKEWRVVSDQSVRNTENERARGALEADFCSITIDESFDNSILQQRLHSVVKQREELQQMETELRAQFIARSEIVGLQNTFEAQMKEHANSAIKFQEQLNEKEQKIHELERKMDEKERELHTIRLDNEAAWAKEDLLIEQSKELQSYRRKRDNAEAERAQHIKQIHELQDHIQEKERQLMELQEQHRIAQETVLFKDEQIREAQAWMTRAQEMDALQSSTNHTLQAELRERTEQYHQLWVGCQRQFGDMERLHLHIQQLQLELADARGKSETHSDAPHVSNAISNDSSQLSHANGGQIEVKDKTLPREDTANLQNGNLESSGGNTSSQTDHVQGVAFAPSSLFGMPTYLPTALHPFVMHQQGVVQSSHVTQSHFHPLPTVSSIQNWQSQQALPDSEHGDSTQNQYPEQTGESLLRTGPHYELEASVNGQVLHSNYLDARVSLGINDGSLIPSSNGEQQVHNSINESNDNIESQLNLQPLSSQFHEAHGLGTRDHGIETKGKNAILASDHGLENQIKIKEHSDSSIKTSSSEAPTPPENFSEPTMNSVSAVELSNAFLSTGQKSNLNGKPGESYMLDERALLASIARTIGSGGRIRISSTLPNRLGKMLAPLHWHDYKRKYGKLDDFVANHPDLFLIEGDYIQLREGAQEIIAATAAVAKVAAAAAAAAVPSSHSSSSLSVALTPMAQSHRLKKAIGNRTNSNRVYLSHGKGPSHGRPGAGVFGKQQNRVQES